MNSENEIMYISTFLYLKRAYELGIIEKDVFNRLNELSAKAQGCKCMNF